jgi:hypothetical protein
MALEGPAMLASITSLWLQYVPFPADHREGFIPNGLRTVNFCAAVPRLTRLDSMDLRGPPKDPVRYTL